MDDTIISMSKIKTDVTSSLNAQWLEFIDILPNIVGALVILLIGIIIAYIFKKISSTLFRKFGLDRISKNAGVSGVMEDAGLNKRPSTLAGKMIFWLVLFVFLVPAANTLGLTELVSLFKGIISFLPKIITALVIVVFGAMFAQFLRRSILEKPATADSNAVKSLGNFIYGIMITVIILVALEQLDIETELLHSIIKLVVAGIMLTLALSIGFGAKGIALNLLSGINAREQFHVGDKIEVNDVVGNIKEVSTLSTIITLSENQSVSIPNSSLYQSAIKITEIK